MLQKRDVGEVFFFPHLLEMETSKDELGGRETDVHIAVIHTEGNNWVYFLLTS